MKSFIIPVIVVSLISVSAFGQKSAPENVRKEFALKYGSAQSVKWSTEEANEWEAEFRLNGKRMSASFDNSGKWIESETAISQKDVPVEILNAISKNFKDYKIGPVEIYESPEMKGYETSLKKGEESWEVIYSDKGVILKKTQTEKED
jgi:hypothetical protein